MITELESVSSDKRKDIREENGVSSSWPNNNIIELNPCPLLNPNEEVLCEKSSKSVEVLPPEIKLKHNKHWNTVNTIRSDNSCSTNRPSTSTS